MNRKVDGMTEPLQKSVVIFYSTSAAIKAESLAKKQSLTVKLIPVPRHLSSDCGICLSFNSNDIQRMEGILNYNKIEYDSTYNL
ncbi:MAG TPA: DUF3343 domain-containing protein [Atribacterota bacterium]|nr:DUF3343 domain-containing protein [Atribacterota bacterium]